jgi:hypothetical protein
MDHRYLWIFTHDYGACGKFRKNGMVPRNTPQGILTYQ